MQLTRREALYAALAGVATVGAKGAFSLADDVKMFEIPEGFKGNIKQSVCKWCFGSYPMAEFCDACKSMGLVGIDLVDPKDWQLVRDHGLTVTMGNVPEVQISVGINRVENHERIIASYAKHIPMAQELGVPNLISLSGDKKGMDPQDGLKNCIEALKKVALLAEKHNVNICLELLNSKDHRDYMADSIQWGIDLVKGVGSERVKILYDIYHMHRMEGDVINNIKRAYDCIGHFHTAGNPGRHDLDEDQELNYRPIFQAIKDLGFTGFVAHEFTPKHGLDSLYEAVKIADV